MHLGADMMGNEPDDPLSIGGAHQAVGCSKAFAQPIDPQTAIGIEHHFDHRRLFKPACDLAAKRRAQHARAARQCLGPDRNNAHELPRIAATDHRLHSRGRSKGHQNAVRQQEFARSVE